MRAKPRGERAERRGSRRVRPLRSARILDISATGLRLQTDALLKRNRVYDLVLRLDEHRIPVAARVVRLDVSGGSARAGLVFERIFDSDRELLEQTLVREVAERMTVILR